VRRQKNAALFAGVTVCRRLNLPEAPLPLSGFHCIHSPIPLFEHFLWFFSLIAEFWFLFPCIKYLLNLRSTYYCIFRRYYPKTYPITTRWVYALTFLRSVLWIKAEIALSFDAASMG